MGHVVNLLYPEAPAGTWAIASHADPTTPGVAYSDFDCTLVTTGRALSTAGRARFYVTAPVDVTVATSAGVVIDTFTEGVRAELVDIHHGSWTGTQADGTQGLGGGLSVNDFLTGMAASFGSENGYVKETGQASPQPLKDALATVRSSNFPYFNVKAAPYNAAGNGVTIDSTAIQSAIAAAAAAGGGVVFFPAGTYLTTTTLSITHAKVSLLGCSDGTSTLLYTPAAGYAVSVNAASAVYCGNYIQDLGCTIQNANGGFLQVASTPGFAVRHVRVKGTAGNTTPTISSDSTLAVIDNTFDVPSSAPRGLIEITNSGQATNSVFACNRFPANVTGFGSYIDVTGAGAGNYSFVGNVAGNGFNACFTISAGGNYVFSGNSSVGYTVQTTALGAAANIAESASTFPAGFYPVRLGVAHTGSVSSSSRNITKSHASGTVFTPLSALFDNVIDVTGTPVTVNDPGDSWDGCEMILRIRNTTGVAAVVNYNAVYLQAALGNIAANTTRVTRYIRRTTGTTPGWRIVSNLDTL